MIIHASCVAIDGQAVLLMGASGMGKSDVALRLIEDGAVLVSDDQTVLTNERRKVLASPPPQLAGMIEVRHVGLLSDRPYASKVPVSLVITLVPSDQRPERLPCNATYSLLDQPVRWLKLVGHEASTPAKIRLALQGSFHDAG
ncbi:MAG TPA: serine/threonine protein kinase [Rhodospirillaceae bacterium]|nr:serine/threonine protein kinase [Rhodospirillaceae bacterium]